MLFTCEGGTAGICAFAVLYATECVPPTRVKGHQILHSLWALSAEPIILGQVCYLVLVSTLCDEALHPIDGVLLRRGAGRGIRKCILHHVMDYEEEEHFQGQLIGGL